MHDIRRIKLTHIREGLSPGDPLAYWSPHNRETIVQRLAEYENTGLSPQGIKSLEDAYLELLKNEKKQGWISVKDALPETTDHVLCCTVNKAGKQNIVRGYYDAECNGGMWACGMNNNVTHWMPLPEPPREGKA